MDQLFVIRKAAGLELRVHEFAVHHDVEDSPPALNKLRLNPQRVTDTGSQTDRLRFVVSLDAVGDRYLHADLRVSRLKGALEYQADENHRCHQYHQPDAQQEQPGRGGDRPGQNVEEMAHKGEETEHPTR